MNNLFLNWHLGSTFGWGIVGLNVFCHWANDPAVRPLMGQPITRDGLGLLDPLRIGRIRRAIDHSNRFLADVHPGPDGRSTVDATVIDAVGNSFSRSTCYGRRNVARCIFERTELPGADEALDKYDELLVASNWNAQLLEAATGRQPKVIFEGVDAALFCPGPKSGLMDETKFYIFSGGKVEFRKAQDLVLLAFKKFHEGRKDCVLVAAWQSIWPKISAGFRGQLSAALQLRPDGALDIGKWASQNGIDPQCVIDVGLVPNALLAPMLREMDVALLPSRAEACTNLPAKEAMACGVPVIAAVNTGMKDLLNEENCIPLTKQTPVRLPDGSIAEGWGESDLDEIVAALEFAYRHRTEARRIGLRSRQWLIENGRTWRDHANELKTWLLSIN